ncbi:hypothetical protein AERO9AM_10370 [Aeromicrobium sp. 9AM]|nr:hypothetical protein AERO9AM_10370 [Aeromicrobium sp. 9AM]
MTACLRKEYVFSHRKSFRDAEQIK